MYVQCTRQNDYDYTRWYYTYSLLLNKNTRTEKYVICLKYNKRNRKKGNKYIYDHNPNATSYSTGSNHNLQ